MRRRLLWAMVLVTLFAMVGEAIPRIIYLRRAADSAAHTRLERDLGRVALVVQRATRTGAPIPEDTLYRRIGTDDELIIQAPGRRAQRLGPPAGAGAISSKTKTLDGVVLTLRRPPSGIDSDVRSSIGLLIATALFGILLAALASVFVSRTLTRPLDRLANAARRLEAGDVPAAVKPSGIAEIDAVAEAIESGGSRIAELLRAEREFATNANHQIRSVLTALSLRLEELVANEDEGVKQAATDCLAEVDRLSATVEELLLLARTGRTGEQRAIDLRQLVIDHVSDANRLAEARKRTISVRGQWPVDVVVVPGAIGQVIDILLANSLRHGRGLITIRVQKRQGWAEVIISDQGPGIPPEATAELFQRTTGALHGIGLSLARSLVESEGGSLELLDQRRAEFRIRLPSRRRLQV